MINTSVAIHLTEQECLSARLDGICTQNLLMSISFNSSRSLALLMSVQPSIKIAPLKRPFLLHHPLPIRTKPGLSPLSYYKHTS